MSASKRILVVEDEIMIALHMEDTLAELGHSIVTAATASEASALLAREEIDLAILDYHLRDGTSDQIATRLQELDVPFILCSGTAGIEELGEVFRNRTVLAKPFTSDGLVEAIRVMGREDAA